MMTWKALACLGLLLELCAAQAEFTMGVGFFVSPYQAGANAMNITWTGAKGLVTLWLMDGNPDDLNPVARIAC
jgi:hypothetical protein